VIMYEYIIRWSAMIVMEEEKLKREAGRTQAMEVGQKPLIKGFPVRLWIAEDRL
jgi:hypothetical protein